MCVASSWNGGPCLVNALLCPRAGMSTSTEDEMQRVCAIVHCPLLNTDAQPSAHLAFGSRAKTSSMFASGVCCPQPGTAPSQVQCRSGSVSLMGFDLVGRPFQLSLVCLPSSCRLNKAALGLVGLWSPR